MERTLHRQLKERYGPEAGGRMEVALEGFRVDAVAADGRLIEIQSAPLGLLKRKLATLLPTRRVGVVKPVIVGRRVIRRLEPGGIDLGCRRSPRRGSLIEVFDELVGIAHLFPHANLTIDLLAVEVDEVRVARRRRPGYSVVDRVLGRVVESVPLRVADDLWSLLPADLPDQFTTRDLAERIGRSVHFARRVAYCLRQSGSARVVAKRGNSMVYQRPDGSPSTLRKINESAGRTDRSPRDGPGRGR